MNAVPFLLCVEGDDGLRKGLLIAWGSKRSYRYPHTQLTLFAHSTTVRDSSVLFLDSFSVP